MVVVALVVETPASVSISEQVVVAITVLTTTCDMILFEVTDLHFAMRLHQSIGLSEYSPNPRSLSVV